MAPFDPTIGLIVVGRGDPRLAGATLASLRHWRGPPARVVLAVPKGREHAFAAIAAGAAVTLVATAEADLLAAGLAALADHVELVVAAPEGVVFEPGWLDAMRDRAADLAALLQDPNACFYVCGLKAMEDGVVLALRDIASRAGLDWNLVGAALKREGRLHLETY